MLAQSFSYRRKIKKISKFQFVEQNSVECWYDLDANLVQHFMGRYSRCSRYRTIKLRYHTIFTISNGTLKTRRDIYFIIEITALTFVGAVFSSPAKKGGSIFRTEYFYRKSPATRRAFYFPKNGPKSVHFPQFLIKLSRFSPFFQIAPYDKKATQCIL